MPLFTIETAPKTDQPRVRLNTHKTTEKSAIEAHV